MRIDGAKMNRPTHGQMVKAIALLNGNKVLDNVKVPLSARKDKGVLRGTIKQPERKLRIKVIKYLRENGCSVFRLENAICGSNNIGISDLLVFNTRKEKFYFVELKATTGLRDEQQRFKELCEICHTEYRVVKSKYEAGLLL